MTLPEVLKIPKVVLLGFLITQQYLNLGLGRVDYIISLDNVILSILCPDVRYANFITQSICMKLRVRKKSIYLRLA